MAARGRLLPDWLLEGGRYLIGGAISHEGDVDFPVSQVFVGERDSGAERNLGADDSVSAVEVFRVPFIKRRGREGREEGEI